MFDIRKFDSSFREDKLNGFDVMIMQSAESANNVIKDMKELIDIKIKEIDFLEDYELEVSYDKTDILELDQLRIEKEIDRYGKIHGIYIRFV